METRPAMSTDAHESTPENDRPSDETRPTNETREEQLQNLTDAHVGITDDTQAADPPHAEIRHEPVNPDDVPKTELHPPTPETDEMFDVTIIGGGPTGLYAAFYAGMREMSVKIIDSLAELGGQVSALYPEKYIFDVAGFPKIKGKELVEQCVEQGMQFGPTVCLGEKVEKLEKAEDGTFRLTTDKHTHCTRTVIIAAGVGAFAPRKLPDQPEIDVLEGHSVWYFVKSFEPFRGQNLLIIGGGDSALDWCLNLEGIAKSITLAHRRDKWRAHEDSVKKLTASSVEVKTFHEVRSVDHGGGKINSVTLYDNRTQEETTLAIDAMILSLGFIANIGPIK
ncbi:MAG TPA: NAD(P)/FAD-dependent oxidoreductase, partial [Abditibacteriaceae bacterium]